VDLEALVDAEDVDFVQVALMKHVTNTGSRYAASLLERWAALQPRVVKVMPREYKRALADEAKRQAEERERLAVRIAALEIAANEAGSEDGQF